MAYYPYSGYQPMYQPQQPQMQMPQAQPTASIIWVDGYNEAAMYPVAPNAAIVLWDRMAPVLYLKKADVTGKPSMTVYDLVERREAPKSAGTAEGALYATKTDLRAVSDAVEVLRQGLDEMRLKIDSARSGEGVSE